MITLYTLIASAALAGANRAPMMDQETRQEVVRIGDLNLSTEQGLRTFERRVEQAAAQICGSTDHLDLVMSRSIIECRKSVRSSADTQIAVAVARARARAAVAVAATAALARGN